MPTERASLLAERYGGARGSRRTVGLVLVGVAVAVLVGVALWSGVRSAQPPIAARMLTFDPSSDELVRVELQLEAAAGSVVACEVVARGERMATVGRARVSIELPGTDGRVSRVSTHPIATTERALSVELLSCTVPGQTRAR